MTEQREAEQFYITQREKTTRLILLLHLTVGELLGWVVGIGMPLIAGIWRLVYFLEKRGKRLGEDEARENYQLDTIDKLLADYDRLKEDIQNLYRDKADQKDLGKLLDRFDKLMSILLEKTKQK